MKTATLPRGRVSPKLKKRAEAVLEDGETLAAFVIHAVTRQIERRESQREFIVRGLTRAAEARRQGKYVSAGKLLDKLQRRLNAARTRAR